MTARFLLSIDAHAADARGGQHHAREHAVAPRDQSGESSYRNAKRRFIALAISLLLLHTFCMLYRYGQRPPAPVIGDEVTINDPAIGLSRGLGLVAPSFQDSIFGFDKLYAHFPPVYLYVESFAFRLFGVSVGSLRLTTTVTDICAAAVFLLALYWLCRRRFADWGAAGLAALLYTLNASVIALHRIARMEPLVELFCVLGLWTVLAGTRCLSPPPLGQTEDCVSERQSFLLIIIGCAFAGISMVTHPEALTAVLPILLLVCFTPILSNTRKLIALAIFAATPAIIWVAAYGSRSLDAVRQLWTLVRFTPGPGVVSFAQDFTREDHRNISQGMRATLFVLCIAVLSAVLVRWLNLEKGFRLTTGGADQALKQRLSLARAFGVATALCIVLLLWFVGASVSRYEVMFPVYLLGLVLLMRGLSTRRGVVRAIAGLTMAVVFAEMVATAAYLGRSEGSPVDADPHRFDFIVQQIPKDARVAATPMLWLAFQQEGRPFTLLYWRYDGRKKWAEENGGNPLRPFDAVVIDESFVDDYRDDTPFAREGRTEQNFVVGSDVVHLYLPRR